MAGKDSCECGDCGSHYKGGKKDEELARMEYDYRMFQQRAGELQQQLQQIQALLAENDAASAAVAELEKSDELLVPLGSGVMAKAKVADKHVVLVEVGGRVITEKKIADALASLVQKKERLSKAAEGMQNELMSAGRSIQAIEEKAASIQGQ
ncbi:prefoldin subunit alpha [Candidatus Micrarchaeota archaeon CG1_02_51_15]|nr:MAG: prefoldin subunit alpha [Candidatus Micrarchaeota archaeon CG1_02_51_15]